MLCRGWAKDGLSRVGKQLCRGLVQLLSRSRVGRIDLQYTLRVELVRG